MKNKFLKVTVALLVIMSLTMANFVAVVSGAISYASTVLQEGTKTNNKNVTFDVYFKNENQENVSAIESSIDKQDMKLYVRVAVTNEGYFDGVISLNNSNFTLKTEKLSEKVNKIEGNQITLNQINAGESVEIEVGIQAVTSNSIDSGLLNLESELSISGIYRDSSEKDIEIEATRQVQWVLTVPQIEQSEGMFLSSQVITNKVYNINGENKRLVQLLIESGLENNEYPIKNTNIELNVPENVEEVNVTSRGTLATNGNSEDGFSSSNWEYAENESKLIINVENTPIDGMISWNKSEKDQFVVTFVFNEAEDVTNQQISLSNQINLFDNANTIIEGNATVVIAEELDGIISTNITATEGSMYKGKLYSGEDRTYTTKASVYVNYTNVEKTINTQMGVSTYYINESTSAEANSQYVSTSIKKSEVTKVLGETGTLTILSADGSVLYEINSSTEADESGNVVITYPEGTKQVLVQSTNPVSTGTINLNNTKVIKAEGYDRNTIGTFAALVENVSEAYQENNSTFAITLNETRDAAKLELDRSSLSTITENTRVEIKFTLLTNSEEYNLYSNPTIRIELPSQVQDLTVNSIDLLYGYGLQAESAVMLEENGVKVIQIQLAGTQTTHAEDAVEGTTIIINADMVLDKKAISSSEAIRAIYANQASSQQTTIEQAIEVVSPRGLVTTNSIDSYGLSSIGEEGVQSAKLELGVDAVQTQVNIEVINNNDNSINDVKILGSFPTKGDNNTIDTTVSGISVSGAEATIYYSENEYATEDLNNEENGWTTEFTSESAVKSYLIVINSMEVSQMVEASYLVNIPAGLGYNMTAQEGYKVTYTNSVTNVQEEVLATTLELTTGKGPELQTTLTAQVGSSVLNSGDDVNQGEVIKYILSIQNTGTEPATDVSVEGAIPEGTTELVQAYENVSGVYAEIESESYQEQIESIDVGESLTLEYQVKVDSDAEEYSIISNQMFVNYNSLTSETEQIDVQVQESNGLEVDIDNGLLRDDAVFLEGDTIGYYAYISNNSENTLENIILEWELPDVVTINYQELIYNYEGIIDDTDEDVESEEYRETIDNNTTVTIESLDAGETIVVYISVMLNEDISNVNSIVVSASVSAGNITIEAESDEITIETLENTTISMTSSKENGYLTDGEQIEYIITATNNNNVAVNGALIYDEVPTEITITSVTVNGTEQSLEELENNAVSIDYDFAIGETVEVIIRGEVNYDETRTEAITITNVAELHIGENVKTSEEVSHIVTAVGEGVTSSNNMISGVAWLDENEDGQRDSNETLLSGIVVRLVDISTGNVAQSTSNQELTTQTNSQGIYIFSNVPEGQYVVVFEFDTSTYAVTAYQKSGVSENKNSDAITKTMAINGQEGTYGVTDILEMLGEGISNIDLGLVTSTIFDLELEKTVTRIVVQNSAGTDVTEFEEGTTLAKVEIAAKQLNNSTVIVEYQIKVTNTGEVAGYVKNIVDYLPAAFDFSSDLNTDWYQSGDYIYNTSLANTKLEAGESKTVTLTLTKTMTEENTGAINNIAEIAESYNESGLADVDSTPGNQTKGEDDMGSAEVIISVKTGAMVTYIGLTLLIIILIAAGAYFVSKKIANKNEIEIDL